MYNKNKTLMVKLATKVMIDGRKLPHGIAPICGTENTNVNSYVKAFRNSNCEN